MKFILLLFLVSCSINQVPEVNLFYKKELQMIVNGISYSGVAVVPRVKSYDIHLISPDNLDYLTYETCHRHVSLEDASYKKTFGWGQRKPASQQAQQSGPTRE